MILSSGVREAKPEDLETIRRIYNEGIEDRAATLDEDPKTEEEMRAWWADHGDRYTVVVAEDAAGEITGWASLNRYSHRCAHAAVADLSVYVARGMRGRSIGFRLLNELERCARSNGFSKIVLFALDANEQGKALYRKCGYRQVGVFKEHGKHHGSQADVVAMEKLLKPSSA